MGSERAVRRCTNPVVDEVAALRCRTPGVHDEGVLTWFVTAMLWNADRIVTPMACDTNEPDPRR
jgi:hypothetical protein